VISIETALTPGFWPAASAVYALLEGTLPGDDVDRLVELALFVARPYVQAETLADLADDLTAAGFGGFGAMLDQISFEIRERLDGHR
jgi:hypothetical protein